MKKFKIVESNSRRKTRGVEFLRVEEYECGSSLGWFWAYPSDIKKIKSEYGEEAFLNISENPHIKGQRIRVEYDTPMFFKSSIFTEERGEEHGFYFNQAYPSLNMLDFFVDGADVDFSRSPKTRKYGIEFTLTPEIERMLLSSSDGIDILQKTFVKEQSEDTIHINSNTIDIDGIGNNLGTTAFLEGDFVLSEKYDKMIDIFKKRGGSFLTIADLYRHPDKLMLIREHGVENLVISTTGTNPKLKELVALFKEMRSGIKRIIFIDSATEYLPVMDGCDTIHINSNNIK
jgi:hypothetical protein